MSSLKRERDEMKARAERAEKTIIALQNALRVAKGKILYDSDFGSGCIDCGWQGPGRRPDGCNCAACIERVIDRALGLGG